jgi:hypothetical protein
MHHGLLTPSAWLAVGQARFINEMFTVQALTGR